MPNTLTLTLSATDICELSTLLHNNRLEHLEVYDKLIEFLTDLKTIVMRIPLLDGGYALVSDEDFKHLAENIWDRSQTDYVVCIRGPLRGHYMHRIVRMRAGLDMEKLLKYIDGNKLNNQRGNLGYV